METMVYMAVVLLASYVLGCVVKLGGVPASVSQTWFGIVHKWIFSVVMVVSFGLLFVPMVEMLGDSWEWCAFVTCAGGVLIGFAPNLNDVLVLRVHLTGAAMLGIGSQVAVGVLCPWLLAVWVPWIPFAFGEKKVFWAEVIGGGALMGAVMI